jgi:prepilin-type N-terminal cleavage/methylation domain-containing protein
MRHVDPRGFTALELLVVLAVFGILLSTSYGGIQGLVQSHRLTGATNQVVTHMRLARERAVSEGNDFVVTFRANMNDYQVWDDEGSDAVFGPDDVRRTFPMPPGTLVQNATFFGANRVTFRPDGTTDASGSVQVNNGENFRQVNVLASTGKVTVAGP